MSATPPALADCATMAEAQAFPADVIADIWERLVESSIAYELDEWDRIRG